MKVWHILLTLVVPIIILGEKIDDTNTLEQIKINDPIELKNRKITELRFSNLQGEIPANSFSKLPQLITLELFDNITYIEPGAFYGLDKLLSLNLRNNRIRYILKATFDGLVELRNLSLAGNRINYLEKQAFYGLDKLEELDVSYNYELKILRPNVLFGLLNLKKLKLNFCGLTTIETNAFNNLVKLQELQLSSNQLTQVTAYHLDGCRYVKILNLSGNKITNIDGRNLGGYMQQLMRINIVDNPIKCLDAKQLADQFERRGGKGAVIYYKNNIYTCI